MLTFYRYIYHTSSTTSCYLNNFATALNCTAWQLSSGCYKAVSTTAFSLQCSPAEIHSHYFLVVSISTQYQLLLIYLSWRDGRLSWPEHHKYKCGNAAKTKRNSHMLILAHTRSHCSVRRWSTSLWANGHLMLQCFMKCFSSVAVLEIY